MQLSATIDHRRVAIEDRWPQAYLDGELCGVGPDGVTSFSMIQAASDSGNAAALVFFLFDLLYLDGEDVRAGPLIERKQESLVDAGGRCSQHRKSGSHGLSAGGRWIRTSGSA